MAAKVRPYNLTKHKTKKFSLVLFPFSILFPRNNTMNHKSSITFFVVFSIFVLSVSGCGTGAPPGFPQVVPCEVSILKDGVPLPQVTVLFVSDGGAKEWFVSGETDVSGVTTVYTSINNYSQKGAPEGTYKITLSQIPQVENDKSQQELFDMSPAEKAEYVEKRKQQIKDTRSFPLEFESHVTTPISVTVTKAEPKHVVDVSEWIGK